MAAPMLWFLLPAKMLQMTDMLYLVKRVISLVAYNSAGVCFFLPSGVVQYTLANSRCG